MGRVFTLQEARELLPAVQDLTRPVFELAASLAEELQQADEREDEERAEELRERLQTLVESWAEAIRDLGAEVKGLWLVDFDSGDSTQTFDFGKFLERDTQDYGDYKISTW